ncbi:MAG: hypothetical protein R2873_19290 [Caldilineaceae bacterium]
MPKEGRYRRRLCRQQRRRRRLPSAYASVISVASTDSDDGKSDFSTYGDWVDVNRMRAARSCPRYPIL